MTDFKINRDGVPVLSADDIEREAEEVIKLIYPDALINPCETPLLSFLEETAKINDFSYDFSQDLGENSHGHKVLGKFRFSPKAILIDRSLAGDLRQKFVIGHEFGHLVLHADLLIKRTAYADVDISDIKKDLLTGKKLLLNPRDWLEWQANRFSSAILMPRRTIQAALVGVQKSIDIHRNVGHIYLHDQEYSIRDFQRTLEGLQSIYKITKTSLKYRLIDLSLIIDAREKGTKFVTELFREK
jgi:Zn-dependent peptidase ImmA (M78 family)